MVPEIVWEEREIDLGSDRRGSAYGISQARIEAYPAVFGGGADGQEEAEADLGMGTKEAEATAGAG
jgi:hypothetical protein